MINFFFQVSSLGKIVTDSLLVLEQINQFLTTFSVKPNRRLSVCVSDYSPGMYVEDDTLDVMIQAIVNQINEFAFEFSAFVKLIQQVRKNPESTAKCLRTKEFFLLVLRRKEIS